MWPAIPALGGSRLRMAGYGWANEQCYCPWAPVIIDHWACQRTLNVVCPFRDAVREMFLGFVTWEEALCCWSIHSSLHIQFINFNPARRTQDLNSHWWQRCFFSSGHRWCGVFNHVLLFSKLSFLSIASQVTLCYASEAEHNTVMDMWCRDKDSGMYVRHLPSRDTRAASSPRWWWEPDSRRLHSVS